MKHNDSGMPKGVKAILFGTIGGMILCTAELLLAAVALVTCVWLCKARAVDKM